MFETGLSKVLFISFFGSIVNSSLNNTSNPTEKLRYFLRKFPSPVFFKINVYYASQLTNKRPMIAQFVSFSFTPALKSVWKDLEKAGLGVEEWERL